LCPDATEFLELTSNPSSETR